MKIIVSGSADYYDGSEIFQKLDRICSRYMADPNLTIMTGGRPGVEAIAEQWANANRIKLQVWHCDQGRNESTTRAYQWERDQSMIGVADAVVIFQREIDIHNEHAQEFLNSAWIRMIPKREIFIDKKS